MNHREKCLGIRLGRGRGGAHDAWFYTQSNAHYAWESATEFSQKRYEKFNPETGSEKNALHRERN